MENRDRPDVKNLVELAFGMRPADELYAIKKDPGQLENLADRPEYEPVLKRIKSQLLGKLDGTADRGRQENRSLFHRQGLGDQSGPKETEDRVRPGGRRRRLGHR